MFDLEAFIKQHAIKIIFSTFGSIFIFSFLTLLMIGSLVVASSSTSVSEDIEVNGETVYESGIKEYNQEPSYMTSVLNMQKSIYKSTNIVYSTYDIMYADILLKNGNLSGDLTFSLSDATSCSDRLESQKQCFSNPKLEAKWRKEHTNQLQVLEYAIEMPYDGNVVVTAGFGYYDQTDDGTLEAHYGVDLVGTDDKTINSPSKPTSVNSQYDACINDTSLTSCGIMQIGNAVILKYDDQIDVNGKKHTLYSQYGHLEHNKVATGDKLSKRQNIGTEGSTGLSTGSHLHLTYGTYESGVKTYVDPFLFLIPKMESTNN